MSHHKFKVLSIMHQPGLCTLLSSRHAAKETHTSICLDIVLS